MEEEKVGPEVEVEGEVEVKKVEPEGARRAVEEEKLGPEVEVEVEREEEEVESEVEVVAEVEVRERKAERSDGV